MKKIFALFTIGGLSVLALSGVFAQQSTQATSSSNIIANVNLVNQVIVKQEGRLFTLGVNIQNKIGTQSGVMYGVQTYQTVDNKRVLVDEFAILDPLTIKQNEYVYKEFAYPLPTSISGNVELFAFLKTNQGILLSVAPLGTREIESVAVAAELRDCKVDASMQQLSCTLVNKTTQDQNVVIVTQVKQGDSVFAPVAQALAPQVVLLKSKEERVINQQIDASVLSKNAFFETVLIDQKDSSLVERATVLYVSEEQARSIDNILIEQTSAKEYVVKIVSLSGRGPAKATVAISDAKGVCATQETAISGPVTEVPFVLSKVCSTTAVSVAMIDDEGKVLDTRNVPHTTLFPQESNLKTIAIIIGLVTLLLIFVSIKNRKRV